MSDISEVAALQQAFEDLLDQILASPRPRPYA